MSTKQTENSRTPLVTIAIPAYNVEKFITRSLLSALNQSFTATEILLIIDGSGDNTLNIVRKIKTNHPGGRKIKIINNKTNQGIGRVRNMVIDKARGRYLFFLDGDDYIEKDTIKLLYEQICRTNDDFVSASYRIVDENDKLLSTRLVAAGHFDGKYAAARWLSQNSNWFRNVPLTTWNKLYNLQFLKNNNIRCIPTHQIEDVWFTFQTLLAATSFTYLPLVTLSYVQQDKSIMHIVSPEFYRTQALDICTRLRDRLQAELEKNRNIPPEITDFFVFLILDIFTNRIIYNKNDGNRQKELFFNQLKTLGTIPLKPHHFKNRTYKFLFSLIQKDCSFTTFYWVRKTIFWREKCDKLFLSKIK